ncbi:MAG: murein biosynthesis integral membrane protein MurJ, partial [Kordiimonas sp.]
LIAAPILTTLFQSEAFSAADVQASAAALMVYAVGLPAYVISKTLTPGFFARKDTKTPVRIAVVSLVINTVLNIVLIQYFAHVGLAIATAIAAWVNAIILYIVLKKRGHITLEKQTIARLIKCIVSTAVMGTAVYYTSAALSHFFQQESMLRIAALGGLIICGVVSYIVAIAVMRTFSLSDIKGFIRSKA